MKKYDVTALGELLIDFTSSGMSGQNHPLFEANPGGAPCNVLAMLQKLNHKTCFIGKVGNDIFGKQLIDAVKACGIETSFITKDKEIRTTLAFVQNKEDGDREFSFYRNPGADMMLTEDEVNLDAIKESRIFHFGTLSMTHDTVRKATIKALETAKQNNVLISFDPNIRERLWSDMNVCREMIMTGLSYCNILKISDNELEWLAGTSDYDKGIEWIKNQFDIPLICLSLGKKGSRVYYKDICEQQPIFDIPGTVDTTGAGDTFGACILHFVLMHGLENLTKDNLVEMLKFANCAAGIITTRKGALSVMPEPEEISSCLAGKN